MTHYLRTKENNTVVEAEGLKDELSVVVCIWEFSDLLLSQDADDKRICANDFDTIQEFRAEWFETVDQKETPDEFLARRLQEFGEKWGLGYVTD